MNGLRKNWDLIVVPTVVIAAFIVLGQLGFNTPLFEFFGIVAILMGSLLAKRENKIGPVLLLTGNTLLLFYFIAIGLTGQIIFTIFFLIINAATIYSWIRPNKKTKSELRPSNMTPMLWLPIIFIIAAAVWYGARGGVTGGLDYMVMAAGILGNILLIRKKIAAWGICMLCDCAGVVLFALTGSWLLVLKSIFSIYNEIDAIIKWRREIKS